MFRICLSLIILLSPQLVMSVENNPNSANCPVGIPDAEFGNRIVKWVACTTNVFTVHAGTSPATYRICINRIPVASKVTILTGGLNVSLDSSKCVDVTSETIQIRSNANALVKGVYFTVP